MNRTRSYHRHDCNYKLRVAYRTDAERCVILWNLSVEGLNCGVGGEKLKELFEHLPHLIHDALSRRCRSLSLPDPDPPIEARILAGLQRQARAYERTGMTKWTFEQAMQGARNFEKRREAQTIQGRRAALHAVRGGQQASLPRRPGLQLV